MYRGEVLLHELGRLMTDVEVDVIKAVALDLIVIGACHDVARGQFHPLRIVLRHIALTRDGVDEVAAFAAYRLRDQEVLDLQIVEAGRVELHHFHIGYARTRPPRHRNAIPRRAARGGAEQIDAASATGRQHGGTRNMGHDLACRLVQRVGTPDASRSAEAFLMVAGDKIDACLPRQQCDVLIGMGRLEKGILHGPAGSIVDMHDAAMGMAALAREMQVSALLVEGHAQFDEAVDRRRCALDDISHHFAIVEAGTCHHRVAHMVVEGIACVEHGRDPPLRPSRAASVKLALGQYQHALFLRQGQRRGKASSPRTDD